MRPGDFSPGNMVRTGLSQSALRKGFNEAGGFLPRKHGSSECSTRPNSTTASMRPGDFSPGNDGSETLLDRLAAEIDLTPASMRPGDFSPGNLRRRFHPGRSHQASMRPGDFSPGNPRRRVISDARTRASMRPGDFSPGNAKQKDNQTRPSRFNEAGGFLPRKHASTVVFVPASHRFASMRPGDFSPGNPQQNLLSTETLEFASMRPGDFSPGNLIGQQRLLVHVTRFNEAGGFLPRKPVSRQYGPAVGHRFNEAGGFLPRKQPNPRLTQSYGWQSSFNEAGGFLPRKPGVPTLLWLSRCI